MHFAFDRHCLNADMSQHFAQMRCVPVCCMQAAAFERIKSGCLAPFPCSQYALVNVQPFGSYANGLSLAASDIDVVITGVTYPDDGRGGIPPTEPCPVRALLSCSCCTYAAQLVLSVVP